MAQFVRTEWAGFEAIHRYEDLAVIASVLREQRPEVAIELGTAKGGFAAFLAHHLLEWGGQVLTLDVAPDVGEAQRLVQTYPNIKVLTGDVLAVPHPAVLEALLWQRPLLYCDNGKKERELRLYAPYLPVGGMIGTHDYGTEVGMVYAEALMEQLGFTPHRHAEFEALAHPEYYPVSLTRFWLRRTLPEPEEPV